ncbi:MAG: hypothetical protein WC761_04395 [Candidatus Paceibacterota bacterium]|jgi:hypothetical protein
MIATHTHGPILGSAMIGVPTFLVVHSKVHYNMAGFKGVLSVGGEISYKKHGLFRVEYVGDSYGILHHEYQHLTWKIYIPPERRIYLSKGRFTAVSVDYPSFQKYFS